MKNKKYWFRAKNYGWGWYPSSWQGILITLIYFLVVLYRVVEIDSVTSAESSFVMRFVIEMLAYTAILIFICYKKGEKPEWRWGGKKIK